MTRAALAVAALAVLAGCGGGDGDDGDDDRGADLSALSPIPTSPRPAPGDAFPDALLQGTLAADGECLWVQAPDGERVDVVWPHGHAADFEADPARLIGPDGRLVALAGDRIAAGGGFVGGDAGACALADPFTASPDLANCTRAGGPLCG